MKNKISNAVLMRLPRYYRYLSDLLKNGEDRISSKKLSEIMGLTASQVRQDLNHFGEFGLQGYGYNIQFLKNEIGKVMGIDHPNSMVLLGYGNLAHSIIKYSGFKSKGFTIKAVFDRSNKKCGTYIDGIPILPLNELEDYINNNDINIIIVTIPKDAAQNIISNLKVSKKIGIWNFASTDLKTPSNFVVENVHLSESLMRLTYKLWGENKIQKRS